MNSFRIFTHAMLLILTGMGFVFPYVRHSSSDKISAEGGVISQSRSPFGSNLFFALGVSVVGGNRIRGVTFPHGVNAFTVWSPFIWGSFVWVTSGKSRGRRPWASSLSPGWVNVGLVLGLVGVPCQLLIPILRVLDTNRGRGLVDIVGFAIVEVWGKNRAILASRLCR